MSGIKGFIINLALALAVGFLAGGLIGSAAAALVLCAFAGLFLAWRHQDRMNVPTMQRLYAFVRQGMGLFLRLVGIPFGLIGALLLIGVAFVQALLAPLAAPLRLLACIASVPGRLRRFAVSLFQERALPWTLGNITLLLVIGVLALGIDVAFYVALIAVPLLLLALAMLAITGGEDPDAVADEQH